MDEARVFATIVAALDYGARDMPMPAAKPYLQVAAAMRAISESEHPHCTAWLEMLQGLKVIGDQIPSEVA